MSSPVGHSRHRHCPQTSCFTGRHRKIQRGQPTRLSSAALRALVHIQIRNKMRNLFFFQGKVLWIIFIHIHSCSFLFNHIHCKYIERERGSAQTGTHNCYVSAMSAYKIIQAYPNHPLLNIHCLLIPLFFRKIMFKSWYQNQTCLEKFTEFPLK